MEKLLSTKRELKFVPECYKLPPDCRPGNTIVPICEFIPVIDFKEEQPKLIQQIIHASKQYGFFQILSNGKVKSVEHRVVTNKNNGRTTVGSFIYPCPDCQIEPTKALINENNPPLYKQFTFKDFMATYVAHTSNRESPLKHYQLQPN
ncbi:hyoscyamine 6-dioxygenase isoform X2 [Cannabis sativa]|uniref:hyoscyamine 6-dioxygenase isoform X2 n=1 Tax=Cannabis sativa TaxID=3483 RepID=UPI0029CA1BBD|nr:hyoscyamine 6-dioxygenase isoform X2 [Cannabis sativa]